MKKLKLEILDPTGNTAVTHHIDYYAGENNRLRLSISDNVYLMDSNGKLLILTQDEIGREEEIRIARTPSSRDIELKQRIQISDLKEPYYYNPKTDKTQKLFEEQTLNQLWEVYVDNYNVIDGDKGAEVRIVVEAQDMEQARDKAINNNDFMQHVLTNFTRDHFVVHKPVGNYVIGKIEYYSGDPRL